MSATNAQEKKREAAKLRKRQQREREKAHKQAMDAEVINVEIYKGTRQCLDKLMIELGYTEQSEIITHLLHGAHRLLECDKSQIQELLKCDWELKRKA